MTTIGTPSHDVIEHVVISHLANGIGAGVGAEAGPRESSPLPSLLAACGFELRTVTG